MWLSGLLVSTLTVTVHEVLSSADALRADTRSTCLMVSDLLKEMSRDRILPIRMT